MSKRRIGLDYVRAAAILSVLVCHTLELFYDVRPSISFPLGVLGVEIFFVLSGYLIGGIFLKSVDANHGVISPRLIGSFWVRRWMRTVPNYLLFLVIFYLVLPPRHPTNLARYLTFTQNLAWKVPSFFSLSWSLSIEEWFYLLFPVLVLLGFLVRRQVKSSMLAATLLMTAVPLLLRLFLAMGHDWDEGVRKVVIFRLDSLMWGVLLAAIERYRPAYFRLLQRSGFVALGVAIFVVTCVWVARRYAAGTDDDFAATRSDALIFYGFNLATALIIPTASAMKAAHRTFDGFFERTSLWSYSMYLSHIPILLGIKGLASRHHLHVPYIGLVVAFWIMTYVVSGSVYYGFELPIIGLRDRLTRQRTVPHVPQGPPPATVCT